MPAISLKPNLTLPFGGRRGGGLVGLDIQPGYVAAVQAHVNGGISVQHAVGAPLPPDAIREGEVLDERTLSEALRELFGNAPLGKRVRIGLANQRSVLRTLELPPVTDRKELAAAVRFQAEDQVPMPLANAVLDFHSLGTFDTPEGPRQRVIVVAAQREMVERLLRAVRGAGLRPEGVDLSAFALIRSLYRPASGVAAEGQGLARVLYLNIGGLTNMAIAEGSICRFTRVVGGGLEAMASEIAERRGVPLVDARALLAAYDLNPPAALPVPVPQEPVTVVSEPTVVAPAPAVQSTTLPDVDEDDEPPIEFHEGFGTPPPPAAVETWALAQEPQGVDASAAAPPLDGPELADSAAEELAPSSEPALAVEPAPAPEPALAEPEPAAADAPIAAPAPAAQPAPIVASVSVTSSSPSQKPAAASDADVRMVLENGIREIVGEVRNSLDFHRSQDGGGEVSSVVLSGPALEIAGFAEALEADLGIAMSRQSVHGMSPEVFAGVSEHRLAIATGLATEEAPR